MKNETANLMKMDDDQLSEISGGLKDFSPQDYQITNDIKGPEGIQRLEPTMSICFGEAKDLVSKDLKGKNMDEPAIIPLDNEFSVFKKL